jgi:hypothetical protein
MKFVLMLLLLVSCATVKSPSEIAIDVLAPIEVVAEKEPVEIKEATKVQVVSLTGFNATQEARFRKILSNVEKVINSERFKKEVLDHTYQDKKQFVDTTDSNEQVLTKILSKTWAIEYRLEMLSRFSSTVGYTYPNVTWIVLNARKYPLMSDADVANNIIHEYGGHKLGRYGHAQKWNAARDYSTPYGLGNIGEKVYVEMFGK